MKIENSKLWNDPLVRETLENVAPDLDDLNDSAYLRVLVETDSLDALNLSYLISETGSVFGTLPPSVEAFSERMNITAMREKPEILFEAEDTSGLKMVLAVLVSETTGAGLEKMKSAMGGRMQDFRQGMDLIMELADRMVETGAVHNLPPALVEKFTEGLDNVKPLMEQTSRRKVMAEASASLKFAMQRGNVEEVCAPRIDPDSQYARLKSVARTKLKL